MLAKDLSWFWLVPWFLLISQKLSWIWLVLAYILHLEVNIFLSWSLTATVESALDDRHAQQ